MSKIDRDELIREFRRMYDERWTYVWSAAREGCVDCSGAFVWAYRQLGRSIPHGSNAIARNHVEELLPIKAAAPGMAAFKIRKPGQEYYKLPDKYKGGADLNDYYHIGLVDETGKWVLNAQGEKAGFTRTKISAWGCVGKLKAVEYGDGGTTSSGAAAPPSPEGEGKGKGDVKPMHTMRVYAEHGMTVKMRSKPSTQAMVIANILVGETVQAGETTGDWTAITAPDGRKGFMMSKFLVSPTEDAEDPSAPAETSPLSGETGFVRTLSTEEYNQLCQMRDRMEADLKLLKSIVGVG